MTGRLFVFGLGFSAARLAELLLADGWRVGGTTRSAEKRAGLVARGIEAVIDAPDAAMDPATPAFAEASHILTSVPPGEAGDPVLARFGARISGVGREWIGYLSTTGVYGDRGGGEVDETDEARPSSPRTVRRVAAEAAWRALDPAAHVFRLAGIYGPGRNPLQQLVEGRARRILKPGHRFSRIHVDDIAAVVMASMARPRPGAVYNVCDDLPAESPDVMAHAAELLGVDPPPAIPFAEAELSPMAASFYGDNKTVANGLIKRELGVVLRYPTYREGLAALMADYSAG